MAGRLGHVLNAAGRDLFVPLVFSLALRLEQITLQEFIDEPALATFALRSAQTLFGADGTINWFGAFRDERGPAAGVELARRLCAQTGDGELVLGYVDGAAFAGSQALVLARAYGDAGASAVLVAQADAVTDASAYAQTLAPLCNLAEYYQMPVVWLARHDVEPALAARLRGVGALIAGPPAAGADVLTFILDAAPLPAYEPGRGRLVLTNWDVAESADPASVTAFGREIRAGTAT
jgi:hypothetical protein